jgi:hypothetical protein
MPLTRAQYLSGDKTQGSVLTGQVQGIKGSASIIIDNDGTARISWATTLGLGLALDGTFVKVALPALAAPPTAGIGQLQSVNGSLYWDDSIASLFLRYANNGNPTWIQIGTSYISNTGGGSSITGVFGTNGISGGGSGPGAVTLRLNIGSLTNLP